LVTALLYAASHPNCSDLTELDQLKRRSFITLLGSAAAAWPLAARAQQPGRMRRIGVLSNLRADDPEWHARLAALLQGLQELGWTVGRNVQIDYRLGAESVAHGGAHSGSDRARA
jgi:hypothetical protein